MRPSCTAQLAEVFSPLEARGGRGGADEPAEAGAETGGGWDGRWRQPLVVDEGHFSREALWRLHLAAVRAVRAVPRRRRLCLELVLLGVVLAHVCALVALHASLLASPLSGGGALAHSEALLSALRARHPAGGDGATDALAAWGQLELLSLSIDAARPAPCLRAGPEPWWCARLFPGAVRCELAREAAVLQLPLEARSRALEAGDGRALLALTLPPHGLGAAGAEGFAAALATWVPGLAPALLTRRILTTVVTGPLRDEAVSAAAASRAALGNASSAAPARERGSASGAAAAPGPERAPEAPRCAIAAVGAEAPEACPAAEGQEGPAAPRGAAADPAAPSGGGGEQQVPAAGAAPQQTLKLDSFRKWLAKGPDVQKEDAQLAHVQCTGLLAWPGPPGPLVPLRRAAELLDRGAEWWLFKGVWLLSALVVLVPAGSAISSSIRAAAFAALRLRGAPRSRLSASARSEALEALVVASLPAALGLAACALAGWLAEDAAALLASLAVGEVCALCSLRAEESRYIFPRALILVHVADAYYVFFHPYGFTWLMHSTLVCFQAFLLVVLLGHFEATVQLPKECPHQLTVEVRLLPRHTPRPVHAQQQPQHQLQQQPLQPRPAQQHFSEQMQRWLLEQGLLLLGDDRSYEAGVVLSALVARALQGSDVPPQGAERGGSPRDEAEEVERYRLASERISSVPGGRMPGTAAMHLLGGGPVAQMLVYHGFRGEHRCDELLRHLLPRMYRPAPADCAAAAAERLGRMGPALRAGGGPDGEALGHPGVVVVSNVHITLDSSAGERLGVNIHQERAFLVIDAVTPTGLVHRWNCQEGSRFVRVEEGDRITAVNGIRGNSHAMLQECMQNKVLEILVEKRRPMQINIGHQQMQQAHSAPRQLPAGTAPLEDAELLPPGAPRAAAHG